MATTVVTKRKLQQASVRYFLLLVVTIGLGGYLGYQNYQEYQATRTALESSKTQLEALRGTAIKAKNDFLALRKDLDSQNNDVNQSVEKIMPSTEDFTNLAREIDKYFLNTSNTINPMFLSDLRFSPPKVEKDSEFGVLPFSMTISGNDLSLNEFLNYIEKSGDLNDKSRLMDINNLNISYQNTPTETALDGTVTEPIKTVNASINLNAYFQKPLEEQK